ncbi:MAG: PspC domain-containing protein [Candidatus Paceibacterota bacterium]
MKKVISVTLGDVVFGIEEDAYTALHLYLESIKAHLTETEDYIEVMEDIERAIAEKFTARNRGLKKAVTVSDVETVIKDMGNPADFGDVSETASTASATETTQATSTDDASVSKKRLYRDKDASILAGVASGLAQYFEMDPVVIRLIFVIAFFFNGLGLLAYLILWLVVPVAETTDQKFAMRGEKVTLSQITDRVKKKLNEVDTAELTDNAKSSWGKVRSFLSKFFSFIGLLTNWVLKVFRVIFGVVFIAVASIGIAGLVTASSVLWVADSDLIDQRFQNVVDTALSDTTGYVFILALLVSIFIPLVAMVMAGASLLVRKNLFTLAKALTLTIIWVTALSLAGAFGALYAPTFIHQIENMDKHSNSLSLEF